MPRLRLPRFSRVGVTAFAAAVSEHPNEFDAVRPVAEIDINQCGVWVELADESLRGDR